MRKSRQAIKLDSTVESVPMTASDANAWERLIRGEGHVWSFDAVLYSSQGLAPNAGYTALNEAVTWKFGTSKLRVDTAIGWPVGNYGTAPTIIFWKYRDDNTNNWDHYVYYGSGVVYKNGVSVSTPTPFITLYFGGADFVLQSVVQGATAWTASTSRALNAVYKPTIANDRTYKVTTAGTAGGSEPAWTTTVGATVTDGSAVYTCQLARGYFDDVVWLPFTMPTSWIPYLVAATQPWGNMPMLTLAGDVIPASGTRTVMGEASSKLTRGVSGGTSQILRTVSATFRQQ
jgi:hypothetical protein